MSSSPRVARAMARAFFRAARAMDGCAPLRLGHHPTLEELVRRYGRGSFVPQSTPAQMQREAFPEVTFPPELRDATSVTGADVRALVRGAFRSPSARGSSDVGLATLAALNRRRALAPCHTHAVHEGPDGVHLTLDVSTLPLETLPRPVLAAAGHWRHAYRVRLENRGAAVLQLLARHWTFTDSHGETVSVPHGSPGVVGLTPLLEPGAAFEYVSGVSLATPNGEMTGGFLLAVRPPSAAPPAALREPGSAGGGESPGAVRSAGSSGGSVIEARIAVTRFHTDVNG